MKRPIDDLNRYLKQLKQEILDAAANANKAENEKQKEPTLPLSEKKLLATGSEKQKDKTALENENFFKRRFGFIKPREQRNHILKLKEQLDLTDSEISNLESSKTMRCKKGKNTVIKADAAPYFMGFIMITLICIQSLPIAGLFLFSGLTLLPKLLGIACCLIIWGTPAYFSYQHTIRPIHLLQQRGLKLGEALVYNGNNFTRS